MCEAAALPLCPSKTQNRPYVPGCLPELQQHGLCEPVSIAAACVSAVVGFRPAGLGLWLGCRAARPHIWLSLLSRVQGRAHVGKRAAGGQGLSLPDQQKILQAPDREQGAQAPRSQGGARGWARSTRR